MGERNGRRTLGDVTVSAVSLMLVILTLLLFHPDVRRDFLRLIKGAPVSETSVEVIRAREAVALFLRSAWEKGLEYQVLYLVLISGVVVLICMLKLKPSR